MLRGRGQGTRTVDWEGLLSRTQPGTGPHKPGSDPWTFSLKHSPLKKCRKKGEWGEEEHQHFYTENTCVFCEVKTQK